MSITAITAIDIRLNETSNDRAPIARGSITLGDLMYIRFTVWSNREGGIRISFPNDPNPNFDSNQPASRTNQRSFDLVGPVSADARRLVYTKIEEALAKAQASGPAPRTNGGGGGQGWNGASRQQPAAPAGGGFMPSSGGNSDPIPF